MKEKVVIYIKEMINVLKEKLKMEWKYDKKELIVIMAYTLCIMMSVVMVIRTTNLFMNLDYYNYHINPLSVIVSIISCIIPFVVWIESTTIEFFYYHKRKLRLFYYCCFNVMIVAARYIIIMMYSIICSPVLSLPTGKALSIGMLVMICRGIAAVVLIMFFYIIHVNIIKHFLKKDVSLKIIYWRLEQQIDLRKNKEYLYDQEIVNDSETGNVIPYYFKDRFMHQFVEGPSGTGKTSSVLFKMIWKDLKRKYNNKNARYEEYKKLIKDKKAILVEGENGKVDPDDIMPLPGYESEVQAIKEKYLDCGYTCIGPDTDLADEVIKYCKIFNIQYYLCDPETINGQFKENYKGINPYHIPKDIPEYDIPVEVSARAAMTADVLLSVIEESGNKDVYFTGLNREATTNISVILMIGMPHIEKKEPKLTDLRRILFDFKRIVPYLEAVKKKYEGEENNPFDFAIDFCEKEMLGDPKLSRELYNQLRGLRNVLGELLAVPNIAETLCADEPIDFAEVLKKGHIVLVNYGIKYGRPVAKGLGLFFAMSFHNEVKKRNLKEFMIPHFEVVDEFSILLHSSWEEVITFLRKYMVAGTFAFQSDAQFDKNDMTKYMKKILKGVGQMIVFGRIDAESAKDFVTLSGTEQIVHRENTVSKDSILSDDPNYNSSERTSLRREEYLDVSDLRNKDFLEVHVYPVSKGKVLPARLGKTYFVTEKEKNSVKNVMHDWGEYVENQGMVIMNQPIDENKIKKESLNAGGFSFEEVGDNDSKIIEHSEEINDRKPFNDRDFGNMF